jgi:protein-S-isoprenylcysteine O-methyltransferase Ste14
MMTPISSIILLGLSIFWGTSLHNVIKYRKIRNINITRSSSARSVEVILGLLGSIFLFIESIVLAFQSYLRIPISYGRLSWIGVMLFFSGCLLHTWSVIARGEYAVSWSMDENHRLIVGGPYSFVRHPSYLAYMLMIIGVSLIWNKWFTLPAWIAIPGYYFISKNEEKILIEKFGEEYENYMERVGAFLPKISRS